MFPVLQFSLIFDAFLAVGISIIGIWSFGVRDTSARLWWRAYALGGVSPALTVLPLGEGAAPLVLSLAALLHAGATVMQGVSIRYLRDPKTLTPNFFGFRMVAVCGLWIVGVALLWWSGRGAVTLIIFGVTCLLASVWATLESWRLHQQRASTFSLQLLVLFGLPTAAWLLRTLLVLQGEARVSRAIRPGTQSRAKSRE